MLQCILLRAHQSILFFCTLHIEINVLSAFGKYLKFYAVRDGPPEVPGSGYLDGTKTSSYSASKD